MSFALGDKENITEAFANVRLFSPSRASGGAKHSGTILERSSKSHATSSSSFHCSDAAARGIMATPSHSHSASSTLSSANALAPKRAPLAKKSGLSERGRRTPLFLSKDAASSSGSSADGSGDALLCSAGISKGSSAVTWNQRIRALGSGSGSVSAAAAIPSAFSSPKNIKRGLVRVSKRGPASGVPHNSPLRGASALQDGSALMIFEDDMLCASLALTAAAAPLQLPRVLLSADGMFDDADAELTSLLQGDGGEEWQEMWSGRRNPAALQLQLRDSELAVMHAGRPEDAVYVQPRRS